MLTLFDLERFEGKAMTNFTGIFQTRFGTVSMIQRGRNVVGDYSDRGRIEGKIAPGTARLEGTFTNGTRTGRFSFTRTADGFDGVWGWNNATPRSEWDGTLVKDERPHLSNAYYEGTYETDFGPVRLKQDRQAVWGDYGDKGTIDAQFDESSGILRGTFTNGETKGRLEWDLTPGGFEGLWAWRDERPEHRWNGTKVAWNTPVLSTYPNQDIVNDRHDRALLVFSSLAISPNDWNWLYEFLDDQGITQAMEKLRRSYATIIALKDRQASLRNIISNLRKLATDTQIREIDMIVHCHGFKSGALRLASDNGTGFSDVSGEKLEGELKNLGIGDRLRMVYSTACWGAKTAPFFIQGGFTCASGAVGVNTNAGTEYPDFLNRWRRGEGFRWSVEQAYEPITSAASDAFASTIMGFSDVNSKKKVFGNSTININSEEETRHARAS
ncbi:hypothetical protein SLH49_15350 [Cognatiyoonia sp. IB215446]|uniref:hypothetical protein n=1 Tax=Cognatiyoonia sp. IB215446 TaxID=3097355 RepID=UPI002A149FF3|nr:hypothetical protein [Cognatiyoonia sp. IB215446]MDX8349362.1 hypothetical protein [Cognatiyoonia sp. IB215446]